MSFSDWKEYNIGDLFDVFSGLSKSRDQFGFGHPFVTFTDVFNNFFLPEKLDSLANTTEKEIKSCSVKKGDIFLTRTSETQHELGMSSVALKDYENATFNGFTKRLRLKKDVKIDIDLKYLGYYLRSPHFRSQILQHSSLTTRASLNSTAINTLKVLLPGEKTQRRIGAILKSLDDKIELNRQTNQTLEAIAQALFKEWFVDFNFPGATGEMVESQLGKIPKGWRVYKVGDLVDSVSITHKFPNEKIIFLNTGDIEEGRILHNNYSNKKGLPGQAKKSIQKGDILFTEIRPANKRYALIDFDAENFVVSTKLMVLRKIAEVDSVVVYNFLTSSETLRELQHLAESRSGTFPQITFSQVKELKLILPTGELLDKYQALAWSIFKQIKNNEEQTKALTELRDSLLPKLMKGEITIK
jgi:type I restriction enzyme S subunit